MNYRSRLTFVAANVSNGEMPRKLVRRKYPSRNQRALEIVKNYPNKALEPMDILQEYIG